ncbi:MAG: undecaprenyl-diphosphate phosphatase [Gammaproteobacteria bacterium]|nr:undecaprenyl-diphosphate phosphatase [Gammaproteobacteria bacterium]
MDYIQTIVLALVQGVTEFLPVSSSAHLVLIGNIPGWQDQGLTFDVALHFGTLVAVVWYFRHELLQMAVSGLRLSYQSEHNNERRLIGLIMLATMPIVIVGFLMQGFIEDNLRNVQVIAYSTIGFGLLLWFADWFRAEQRSMDSAHSLKFNISWIQALVIGLAQVVALIPGTSRSGITITAALLLGISRVQAARFSFILAIPVIFGSMVLVLAQTANAEIHIELDKVLIGSAIAAITAFTCIHLFVKLVERIGMLPFVLYRLLLGVGLLVFI